MRRFEKISFSQFKKDIKNDQKLYGEYKLPERKTKDAAAYDFCAIYDYSLKPGEIKKIPTGIKAVMEKDDALLLIDRSSMGFKHNIRFCNQVGLIDADYYNNEDNEGHIWICIQNEGDHEYVVNKGDGICQGLFVKYLLTDDDKLNNKKRKSDY